MSGNEMHEGVLLTQPIFDRLSRRVQGELNRLSHDSDYFRNRYRKAEALESNTRIQDYQDGDYGLPDGTTVVFSADDAEIEVSVTQRGKRKVVEVKASGVGAGSRLVISPVSANVVEVGTDV